MINCVSLATESPHTRASADETLALLAASAAPGDAERCRALVEQSGVRSRSVVAPLARLARLATVEERNALFGQLAVPLAERVARAALAQASIEPRAVGTLLVTSSTGHMLPTLDGHLATRLGMPASVRRLALNDLGCAGAVRAMGYAADLLPVTRSGVALVVAVELCSLWLQVGEMSPEDERSNALFGDGAGAVVMRAGDHGGGPELLACSSFLWPESLNARGAHLTSSGLRHFASPRIARAVARHLRPTVDEFLAAHGCARADLGFVAVNPSDLRLAACIAEHLALPAEAVNTARGVWERHGNTLAVGPLHMLAALQSQVETASAQLGLLLVLGPGISCDMVLLRWQGRLSITHREGSEPALL
jgi:alkylresorcinol/alkylpyrone synthase